MEQNQSLDNELIAAVESGNLETTKLLLEKYVNINHLTTVTTNESSTRPILSSIPLMIAVAMNVKSSVENAKIVTLNLNEEKNLDIQPRKKGDREKMVDLLLTKIDVRIPGGISIIESALEAALKGSDEEIAALTITVKDKYDKNKSNTTSYLSQDPSLTNIVYSLKKALPEHQEKYTTPIYENASVKAHPKGVIQTISNTVANLFGCSSDREI